MGESLRYIVRNQTILGVLLVSSTMNFLFFPHMTLLPVFARDILGQGSVGLGVLSAGYGVGAFAGLALLHRLRRSLKSNWIFLMGSIYQATVMIPFALSAHFPLSVIMLTLDGLGQSSFAVLQSSVVLESANDEYRARTMGVLNLSIGVGAIGRMQMGAVASALGAPTALAISCGLAVLSMAAIATALPGFRK
jgi:predicted MFS family arabinose efflux permease